MPSSTTSSKVARVLLVDDNGTTLARAAAALSGTCDIVGTVRDGQTALEAAAVLRPDVIVLDISMPGLNGLEVSTRLRELGVAAAVVFLTVHDDEAFILAAREAGGLGYVVKPRLASDLALAVREAHGGRAFVSAIR